MRELTANEIEDVSGGLFWFIACGVALGLAAVSAYRLGSSHGAQGTARNYNFMGVEVTASQCIET